MHVKVSGKLGDESFGGIWFSKTMNSNSGLANSYAGISDYHGLHTGVSGPLYILAELKRMGFDISEAIKAYGIN